MSLPEKLAAFRANFEAGGPPWNAPAFIHEPMHRATDELIASGAADRALRAGERASFGRGEVGPIAAVDAQTTAWTLGQLIADDMRLDDFLAELGRYRPGIVRCDPAVAGLRLSGVFPLADTERILAMLPSVLPVQVRLRTRFWATVEGVQ
ncbi:hypothetical protein [Variovorax paradoxus]|uniref:hypothetical protein n=1 Tax=Variovorax paradoxus TaxID=34073 RepID=UPI0038D1A4E5